MKRYKLLKPLFDHKAGDTLEIDEFETITIFRNNEKLVIGYAEIDLYTRLGVLEEIDENARWKPEKFGEWFWVNAEGQVVTDTWNDSFGNRKLYEFGNCFRTKQEAEAWRDKIKSLQKEA